MAEFLSPSWCGLEWSEWILLAAPIAEYKRCITRAPGLYRVRITGREALAYVGQTGRNLRERTRTLAFQTGHPANDPPWNDPHTAAPGLWVWRTEEGFKYEVSVAALRVNTPHRQCMEDMLLYEYRLEKGESTLANHGRFHPRWEKPSNKKQGRRLKQLPVDQPNKGAGPSLAPPSGGGQPVQANWLGLPWSETVSLGEVNDRTPAVRGVYRLIDGDEVVYLGESNRLKDRLKSHQQKYRTKLLLVSWCVMENDLVYQLKERETDLIGAFYKQVGEPPRFQYGG